MKKPHILLRILIYILCYVHKYAVVYLITFGYFASLCFFWHRWVELIDKVALLCGAMTIAFSIVMKAEEQAAFLGSFRLRWIQNQYDIKKT